MFKKWIMLIVLIVAANGMPVLRIVKGASDPPAVSGVEQNRCATFWAGIANPLYEGTSLDLMVGFRQRLADKLDGEVGFAGNYTSPRTAIGGYAMLHIVNLVEIENPLADQFPWMPATLLGEPFVGCQYLFSLTDSSTITAPLGGFRLFNFATLYYKYAVVQGEPVSDKGKIGLSLRWMF
jgi:hypothetical protein